MVELGVVSAGTTEPAGYRYPTGYEKPPVEEMIRSHAKAWKISDQEKRSALETARRLSENRERPEKSEGLFALPYFRTIGTYSDATSVLLKKLAKKRRAHNFLANYDLRLHRDRNVNRRLARIAEKQGSRLLVFHAQLGEYYAGMSVIGAFEDFDKRREFPLGIFEVGATLLACNHRLSTMTDLFLDCPADQIINGGRIGTTPCFSIDQYGQMILGHHSPRSSSSHYGAVTGFYPRIARGKG